jgi:PST family polysaccharide transporter
VVNLAESDSKSVSIVRAGAYSALATAARLLLSLAIVKIIAWQAGPEGVGRLGQFLSLVSIVVVFAGGGIASGVIKYVAEYRDNVRDRNEVIQTAITYTAFCALAVAIVLIVFSPWLANSLLGDSRYRLLIVFLGFAQLLCAGHNLIMAVLNGLMAAKSVAFIHITGAAIGVVAALVLAYVYGNDGTLYALVLGQAILLGISYPVFRQHFSINSNLYYPKIDRRIFGMLGRYSLMALTSALLAPIAQIVVRNHLASKFSWHDAGYWQAVTKLSDAYLLAITMAISSYYLPKLSAARGRHELVSEIRRAILFFLPVSILAGMLIYAFRSDLTILLFSNKFLSATDLFAPQLIGDVLKVGSFVLSYVMIAKAMTKIFIASEIFFTFTYVLWVMLLTAFYGVIGAMYASVVNYITYLIFNMIVIRCYLLKLAPILRSA